MSASQQNDDIDQKMKALEISYGLQAQSRKPKSEKTSQSNS